MSDNTKALENLLKQVSDMQKAVEAKSDKAEIEKRMTDIVEKRLAAQKTAMIEEMRKGEFEPRPVEIDHPNREMLICKSDDPKVRSFQKWNDDVLILSTLLKKHPTKLDMWRKQAEGVSEMKKAMDSATANEGNEWIPTEFSAELHDRVRLALKVAGLFSGLDMPSDPYKMPLVKSDATAYFTPENTADTGTKITASTPGTNNLQLISKKLAARVLFSEELREDSIVPVLEFVKNNMAIAHSVALEDGIINGDTAGTHMDADVTASTDARKMFNGLRKDAQDSKQVSLATLSTANLRSMRGNMGKYGVDPSKLAWIVSAKGYMKMLGIAEVLTVDKYGPSATILSGELAKLDGIPIIVSEKVRDDLNASGVNDATTNSKGEVLLAYVPAFILGNRRKLTARARFDEENDQQILVTTARWAFDSWLTVTSEFVVIEGVALVV